MRTSGRWILWAILLLALPAVVAAAVSASVDRQEVYDGDTITLTLESDGGGGRPDLSPLKRDFEVLGSGTFNSFSFVNGRQSSKSGWRVRLRPRRLGDLTIPPIDMGGRKTRPILVHVRPVPPEVAARMADQVFVETQIDTGGRPPYVQQQVKLTVRLYYRVRLASGELTDPVPDGDVLVERLGKERRYETVRNGERYQVVERRYALFPQRSGRLQIPSVVFHGRVRVPEPRRQRRFRDPFFDDFFKDPFDDPFFADSPFGGRTEPVVARSPSKTLEVLPPPKGYKGRHWLPARDLKLYDSWTDAPPTLRAGEPVTRILAIRATGLEGSQLPEPQMAETPDYRVYPEQPATSNRVQDGWVVGEIQRAFTVVPQHAGRLVIPEVRLRWWDLQAGEEREAVLPRWELEVAPGAAPAAPPASAGAGQGAATTPPTAASAPEAARSGPANPGRWLGYWPWALALLLAVLIGWLLLRRRRRPAASPPAPPQPAPATAPAAEAEALKAARDRLRQACGQGDPRAVAAALLALAKLHWREDPPLDLPALARRRPAQAEALEALDRALYGEGEPPDNWRALCDLFRDGFAAVSGASRDEKEELPPLYPR